MAQNESAHIGLGCMSSTLLTLLHSKRPKLYGLSECNRVKRVEDTQPRLNSECNRVNPHCDIARPKHMSKVRRH